MKPNTLLFLCAISISASFALAKNKIRQPSSLDCDKSKVITYLKENTDRYTQMVTAGNLTVDEAQFLIKGLNDVVEIQSLACGWTKVKLETQIDACESNHMDEVRWIKMLENKLLSENEYKFLVAGQKELSAVFPEKCKK